MPVIMETAAFSITSILTAISSVIAWIWGLFSDVFEQIKTNPLLFVLFCIPIVVLVIKRVIKFINGFKKG